jgi:hypothetical protein
LPDLVCDHVEPIHHVAERELENQIALRLKTISAGQVALDLVDLGDMALAPIEEDGDVGVPVGRIRPRHLPS